ncbi:Zinc finger, RING-type domain and Zinc finger, RING/FYVE/PHD-type domain-containing protein [Strongyloides ratti]|uniref:Zinc finger, RING-type domain and Zinc finger, RING/FYVE/PHD-type domain-containing protein n=1 Tax=Strongyloides ratti TaxID=34506 RepID=A0A090L8Z5_STRRB|nr:Zinc finger, RING-type domain and Zinc finger, RING/FYVE/PHD-type domain-containing protein [Strongyloides ratti]CEF66226.1 Zinc finger, RING-type domain and Zinc finger, RING/FYVE/PHD-type domain-containing protein [Strongyloides ratti]
MAVPLVFNCHLICYDDFGPDELCVSVKCGHVMHSKCINEWINKQNTCPYCSISTTIHDIIQIYYDETVSDLFSGYYKGKYEKLQKQIEDEKVKKSETLEKYTYETDDTEKDLNIQIIKQKNKKLTNLLYYKIANESKFINQDGLESLVQMEIASKTEQIDFLKLQLLQEKEKSDSNIKEILYQVKFHELEDKIKYQKEEKNKCLQKMANLQLLCNKLINENYILREKYLTIDACQELKNKIKSQTEIINSLTKENEYLKRQKQNYNKLIQKINEKADQKYRDLYIKYQDLKVTSEAMESKSELFEKKEKDFYGFHRNIILLANKLVPIDIKTDDSLRLFMREKVSLNSDLWKKVSDTIFNIYKILTRVMEMDILMHESAGKEHSHSSKAFKKNNNLF